MLYWENENPALGVVHHLMVLAYHLQHPSLYSPEGLSQSLKLLINFVQGDVSTDEVLKNNRAKVDFKRREWKIRSTTGRKASYHHPVSWTMTAQDLVSAGVDQYMASVQDWAKSIVSDLRSTANLEQNR